MLQEELLSVFLNVSPDMAFLKDENFRYVWLNDALAAFYEKPRENVIGATDFDLLPEPAARRCRETDLQALRSGRMVIELEWIRDRAFETYKFPVPLGQGRIGVGAWIRDVTDRIQREHIWGRIARGLASLGADPSSNVQRLVELAGEVLGARRAMYFERRNQTIKIAAQWSAGGPRIAELGSAVALALWPTAVDEVKVTRGLEGFSIAECRMAASAAVRSGTDIVGSVTVCFDAERDLSETDHQALRVLAAAIEREELRRGAEISLSELSRRHEAVLKAIPDIVMVVDLNRVYTWANPAGYAFFGDDVIGHEARDYFVGAQPTYQLVEGLFSGREEVVYVESWQRRRDGEKRLLAWWCCALKDENGRVIGAVSTARDVTDQRIMEDRLRQAEKMDALGRLSGGIAHDFNNMLGVILGYAELALAQLENGHPARQDILEIQKAAERSAALTRQLLTFARRQQFEMETLNLNEEIERMLAVLRRLIREHIELEWRPGENLWPVLFNRPQFDLVLTNLALNAADAMPTGGRLTLQTQNCSLREPHEAAPHGIPRGAYVLVEVADTGVGMDAETLSHLFEPFYTTKAPGKGTGLGLAMVYAAVRQAGGYVTVSSEPGCGTVVRVFIPRAKAVRTPSRSESARETKPGTETVLVVEDEPALLELIKTVLSRYGYNVLACTRPLDALSLVEKTAQAVHVVVTDVVMPQMRGDAFAAEIRRRFPGACVLFISGYSAIAADLRHSWKDRASFLTKPFTAEELLREVRALLDKR